MPFLVDAAQSAGAIPIDVVKMNIDLLAIPGHKSLLGPTGTGALYVSETVSPRPIRSGGTGVFSEVRLQPEQLPYYYEAGTQNAVGIAGLCAGVHYILERSVANIYLEEQKTLQRLMPEIKTDQLIKAPSTVRAQAVTHEGKLIYDLIIQESHRIVHVLNTQSPSATASFSIGKSIVSKLSKRFQ